MKQAIQRRISQLERIVAARKNDASQELREYILKTFSKDSTPQHIKEEFEQWYSRTFKVQPSMPEEDTDSALTRFEVIRRSDGIRVVAKSEMAEWWEAAHPGEPPPKREDVRNLYTMLENRIYDEVYGDCVPMSERRYFFDPESLLLFTSSKEPDGTERMPGFRKVTLRIIRQPTGRHLKKAQKFSKARRQHDPTRRLAALPLLSGKKVGRGYERLPRNWLPPGF